MPFSIIGSTTDVTTRDGRTVKGREYLWGVAEGAYGVCCTAWTPAKARQPSVVDNEEHCDFRKLRSLLLRVHMLDLVTTTEETHYEAYRQAQMETRKYGEPKVKKLDNPKFKEEEELLRKKFTEQVKMEEARFRQWEQHVRGREVAPRSVLFTDNCLRQLIAERDRLNKDLEAAHSVIKSLEVSSGRALYRRPVAHESLLSCTQAEVEQIATYHRGQGTQGRNR